MADIWKPQPEIAEYYGRIEDKPTGGKCQFCQMRWHVFHDPDYGDPFVPLVVWQHAINCRVAKYRAEQGRKKLGDRIAWRD